MQGGAPGTHPEDGCWYEAYLVRTPQRRASARGTRLDDGSPQMGLFQQPARARADDRGAVSRGFRGRQHGAWWLLYTSVKGEKNFTFS